MGFMESSRISFVGGVPMAEVVAKDLFDKKLKSFIDYAAEEFGKKTVKRWFDSVRSAVHRLSLFPESYSLVGKRKDFCFRGIIIMRNFKIIYYYDEKKDVVFLIDIWDIRQNPKRNTISGYSI